MNDDEKTSWINEYYNNNDDDGGEQQLHNKKHEICNEQLKFLIWTTTCSMYM